MAGRPAHVKTPEIAERVRTLSAYGIEHEVMALMFGFSHDTLTKYYREELDTGKACVVEKVANSLTHSAMKGDTQAAKFFLSSRAGWAEKQQTELSGTVITEVKRTLVRPGHTDR